MISMDPKAVYGYGDRDFCDFDGCDLILVTKFEYGTWKSAPGKQKSF